MSRSWSWNRSRNVRCFMVHLRCSETVRTEKKHAAPAPAPRVLPSVQRAIRSLDVDQPIQNRNVGAGLGQQLCAHQGLALLVRALVGQEVLVFLNAVLFTFLEC